MMGAVFGSVRDRAGRLVPALVLFSSLRGYRRSWVPADVLAALTLLVIAVPEQRRPLAWRTCPDHGVLRVRRGHGAVRAAGVQSADVGRRRFDDRPTVRGGVAHLAPAGSPQYVDLVGILAVAVGVFVGLVWLLRLGWMAEFCSAPIIVGFLAGIAVIIVVHQYLICSASRGRAAARCIGLRSPRSPRADERPGVGDRGGGARDRDRR